MFCLTINLDSLNPLDFLGGFPEILEILMRYFSHITIRLLEIPVGEHEIVFAYFWIVIDSLFEHIGQGLATKMKPGHWFVMRAEVWRLMKK